MRDYYTLFHNLTCDAKYSSLYVFIWVNVSRRYVCDVIMSPEPLE